MKDSNVKKPEFLNGVPTILPKIQDIIDNNNRIGKLDRPSKEHTRFNMLASYFYYFPVVSTMDQSNITNRTEEKFTLNNGATKVIADYPYLVMNSQTVPDAEGKPQKIVNWVVKYTEITVPNKSGFNGSYAYSQQEYKSTKNIAQEVNRLAQQGKLGSSVDLVGEEIPVELDEGHMAYMKGKAGLQSRVITCCPTNIACQKDRIRNDSLYKEGKIQEFIMADFGPRTIIEPTTGEYLRYKQTTGLVPVRFDESGKDWQYINNLQEKDIEEALDSCLVVNTKFIEAYKLKMLTQGNLSHKNEIDDEVLKLSTKFTAEELRELLEIKNNKEKEKSKDLDV